ncbi:Cof-type HAD-IIB family hydrolase [Microbacterium sp. Gd 4-13]|uniref:HAD family hydrolase n=1 Tax=Microbacterium sp. Gd 4-13 TaxID=2173179 RepID=UPI000D57A202|nr:HAD family hydrolase [Microbacterium sp. Gd 4-13]PVW03941.1 Cof-type HAD-IIB family hydrolase [Microbacterium sp. Gd 4-13]
MTSRRIAFLDVDGTLIDHQQRLAPSAIEAVRGARARGHLVYLCTGRARAEIPDHVAAIGFDGVISAGGGFTDRGDEHVARHLMPPEDLAELTAFFEAHDVEYILQAYDDIYPSRGILARVRPIFDGAEAGADDPAAVAALARVEKRMAYKGPAPVDAIAKATFAGTHPDTFSVVRDGLGARFHVITGTIPYLGGSGGEVSLHGVTKGSAIVELVTLLGMSLDDAIGIGDSYNDLEMLRVCGVGIAMGNADDTVKGYADEVTTSVHDDGVHTAFTRHGLI